LPVPLLIILTGGLLNLELLIRRPFHLIKQGAKSQINNNQLIEMRNISIFWKMGVIKWKVYVKQVFGDLGSLPFNQAPARGN
jgi:hypothetical protein